VNKSISLLKKNPYVDAAIHDNTVDCDQCLFYVKVKREGSPMTENCQPKKYISMAEAVCRFQKNTPDRFHSKPRTGKKNFI
jgi:hypothetical protein